MEQAPNEQVPTPSAEEEVVATNEQALESKKVVIEMTDEELDHLDELGPDDETVKAWLEANGVGADDFIVARREGKADALFVANANDFLTRDKAASEAWNADREANAARSIVDLDTAIESEPRISEELAEEIGEEALEAAGIIEPDVQVEAEAETQDETTADQLKITYDQQVQHLRDELAAEIARPLNTLDAESESIKLGQRTVLDNANFALQDLEVTLQRYDDYPVGAIQTRLRQTIDGLQSVIGSAGNYSESTIGEVERMLSTVEKVISTQAEHAAHRDEDIVIAAGERGIDTLSFETNAATSIVEAAQEAVGDLSVVRRDLSDLDTGAVSFRNEARVAADALQDMLTASYNRPIDPDEMMQVVQRLKRAASSDGELAESMRKADASLNAALNAIHTAYEGIRA